MGKCQITAPSHIEIEVPKEEAYGDLSTPVAMGLAKELRRPPRKIAEDIVRCIGEKERDEYFSRIEIAGAGFINFTFRDEFIHRELKRLLAERENFLKSDIGGGLRIQVEFVSANPTGPLHLGHGRGAAVGAALSNLLMKAGFRVEKEYYINDAGRQVGLLGESVFARYQELLGIGYPFPEDGYRGGYIIDLAREIIASEGEKYKNFDYIACEKFFKEYSCGRMLELIRKDLEAFGVVFDTWQSEKELYETGVVAEMFRYLREKGFAYESEGAMWFSATRFGDEKDRVIEKANGEYTYFASDIAYHKKKVDRGFDELIDIWGADHHGYIPRVKAALRALGYSGDKLTVVLVQMVALLRGGVPVQMSKRSGEFVTLREVMDEVGADTTKFIFLTRRPDSHLEFDLETAKAQSAENPVFYVQYANARISSIFRNARERGIDVDNIAGENIPLLKEPEEIRLIKKLLLYPMVFENAVTAREPHRITYYLQELAGLFHPYYNRHRVLGEEPELTSARLALAEAVRIVLREGLETLGLTAPERM